MVLRLIPQTILTMEQPQLPDVLQTLAARPKGLILVTGPTGSGKSTTLAAMIDWINRNETRVTFSPLKIRGVCAREPKFSDPAS